MVNFLKHRITSVERNLIFTCFALYDCKNDKKFILKFAKISAKIIDFSFKNKKNINYNRL